MTPTLAILFLLASASSGLGQDAAKMTPVPSEAAQAEATRLVKEVYGDEWARAKTSAEKQTLAKKLLGKANDSKGDPASHFVLLRVARDIATQAGDGPTAFLAADSMAGTFQVDADNMKLAVVTRFAVAAQKPAQHKSVAEEALKLVDQAIGHDNFTVADQLGQLAVAESRKSLDKDCVVQVQGRVRELARMAKTYEEVKAAKATLEKTPGDPGANLVVGKYLCFVKGDWENGLPMLGRTEDTALKALSKLELQGAASATKQARIGDSWWDLADGLVGTGKKQVQEHAVVWYRKALPGLSGLMKDKVEKRLQALVSSSASSNDAQVRVRIINRRSGMCLCLENGGESKSQSVIQQPFARGSLDQQWRIERAQDLCRIVNLKSDGCIAVSAAGKNPGTGIIDWPKTQDALEQQWQIKPIVGGYCTIVSRNSGQCLAIPEASKSAGAKACQWPFAGAKGFEQQWRIEVIPQHETAKPR